MVQEGIYDKFVEKAAARAKNRKVRVAAKKIISFFCGFPKESLTIKTLKIKFFF